MDWYSWLLKTNLDITLVYDYSTTFARNELQHEDLVYFNHEFLQSIGISVAKHRLEILKLTKNEVKGRPSNGFSRLILAMKKTKRLFTYLRFRNSGRVRASGPDPYREKDMMIMDGRTRSIVRSGPLDRRVQEKFVFSNSSVSVSGPLDGKMQERLNWSPMVIRPIDERKERLGYFCKSPTVSGPIDRWGLSPQVNYCKSEKLVEDDGGVQIQSLWSMMFQDMRPT